MAIFRACVASVALAAASAGKVPKADFLGLSAKDIKGNVINFDTFADAKVVLINNVACE